MSTFLYDAPPVSQLPLKDMCRSWQCFRRKLCNTVGARPMPSLINLFRQIHQQRWPPEPLIYKLGAVKFKVMSLFQDDFTKIKR